jgi:hypothetical protein
LRKAGAEQYPGVGGVLLGGRASPSDIMSLDDLPMAKKKSDKLPGRRPDHGMTLAPYSPHQCGEGHIEVYTVVARFPNTLPETARVRDMT